MEHPARILVPTVVISLLLIPLPALFDYVPENHRGYLAAEGRPAEILEPGFHFRVAGIAAGPEIYPFAPIRLVQTAAVQTREGFLLRVHFSYLVRIPVAGMETFHARKGGRDVVEAIRDEAEASLRGAARRLHTSVFFGARPADQLQGPFTGAMGRQGLVVDGLEVAPQDLAAALDVAARFRRQKLDAAARDLLEEVVPRYPRSAELYNTLGRLYAETGDLTRAEEQYLSALYIDLSDHEAMQWLVGYYLHIHAPDRAERLLTAGRDRVPDSVDYRYWLADIYMLMGDIDSAEGEIRAGLESHPDNLGLLVNLGAIEMTRENFKEAVAILDPIVAAHPGEVNAEFNLGTALRRLGRFQEALALFHEMENRGQPAPELLNEIARTYRDIGNPQLAADYLHRSLALRPDQPEVQDLLNEVEQELQP